MPRFPRPAPEHVGSFENCTVLPELAGRTPGDLAAQGIAIKVFCRACGRDVVITPLGLYQMPEKQRRRPIEAVVRAMVCQTCGAREAQASGWPLEQADPRPMYVRQEHARAPFKRTG